MRFLKACVFLLAAFFISCGDIKTVQIWTDRPEFAIYADYYNNVQNRYKVSVRYMEFPAANLGRGNSPDIIVASWLKNSSTSANFRPLNNLFGNNKLSRSIFYPQVLVAGTIDRNQHLLPVSFNIPALIFSKDRAQELSNQFTIDFDEIKILSKNFNVESRGEFTRMGFSPLWNNNFLFTSTILGGASFREAAPLAWNSAALERSMGFINNWTYEINTSNQMEEEFYFKFFIQPPERLIQSGRIFFSYIESNDLFLLSEDSKNHLDFRWIMEQDRIPISEGSVYIGIPRWSRSQAAARAFILWFFETENQRRLMEYFRVNRINESIFGISGGFSALRPVTEQVYPLFYPELLGRMPPSENFLQPNILPENWIVIKERVVLPYLHDRARVEYTEEVIPLERRLSDWMRLNR
jgi:hypothetical protein